MNHTKSLTKYIGNFVDELVASGVEHAVISPGSRSTPIAMLLAAHPEIETSILVDERSAAFFALGIAKETVTPVVLICTSGTAAANYYPAIIEAYYSEVPLIVLTADRPHELRDVDAPQAIGQIKLYGDYVKWFHEMALPEDTKAMLKYARSKAARASHIARLEKGPVQVNFPLREPLVPDFNEPEIWGERADSSFYPTTQGKGILDQQQLARLSTIFEHGKKGLIVCGSQTDLELAEAIIQVSEHLQIPILADPLSQIRTLGQDSLNIITSYDAILKDDKLREQLKPDFIIRFGAMPVSKPYRFYLETHENVHHIIVSNHVEFREPIGMETLFIETDPILLCEQIIKHTNQIGLKTNWLKKWQKMNTVVENIMKKVSSDKLTEGDVVLVIKDIMKQDSVLFTGNSMSVRDCDTFLIGVENRFKVLCNRGANGIDGVVSTAAGVARTGKHVTLLIGDLSFYHDMNGLLAIMQLQLNMTIVIVNNDGGGIFSFLPQKTETDYFEQLFGTPLGIDFKHAATLYNGNYTQPVHRAELQDELEKSYTQKGVSIIEIRTDREENLIWHKEKWNMVHSELRELE